MTTLTKLHTSDYHNSDCHTFSYHTCDSHIFNEVMEMASSASLRSKLRIAISLKDLPVDTYSQTPSTSEVNTDSSTEMECVTTPKSETPPTSMTHFFDFYAMYELYMKVGGLREEKFPNYPIFVNHSIYNRIFHKYEFVVNSFYNRILSALIYSIWTEVRHFPNQCRDYHTKDEIEFYENLEKTIGFSYEVLNAARKNVYDHSDFVHKLFYNPKWYSGYGGKRWAKAAQLLTESKKITSLSEKILWCDRVLDLYHNTGHLLNKTEFCCLSQRNIAIRGKNNKIQKYKTALNYRANVKHIRQYLPYVSSSVRKLIIPRLGLFSN